MTILSFLRSATNRTWKVLTLLAATSLSFPTSHVFSRHAEIPEHVVTANYCPAILTEASLLQKSSEAPLSCWQLWQSQTAFAVAGGHFRHVCRYFYISFIGRNPVNGRIWILLVHNVFFSLGFYHFVRFHCILAQVWGKAVRIKSRMWDHL